MGMYVLLESGSEGNFASWFGNLGEAKESLADSFNSINRVIEGEIAEGGMSAWLTSKYVDCEWFIKEVPVADYLRKKFEEYKGKSGWQGLFAEDAVESFIRFVEKGVWHG